MTSTIDIQDVFEALAGLIEEATMLFVEPNEGEEELTRPDAFVLSRVSFEGFRNGEMEIALPRGVVAEIVANQLGCDADDVDDEGMLLDAAGELANLLVGRLLGDVASEGETMKLSKPHAEAGDTALWDVLVGDERCMSMLVEDEPMLVRIATTGSGA